MYKGLGKKISALLFIRVAGLCLTLLISIFIGRNFGAAGSGEYYLFVSVMTLLVVVSKFGLELNLIKFIPKINSEESVEVAKNYIGRAFLLAFLLSVFVAISFWAVGGYFLGHFMAAETVVLFKNLSVILTLPLTLFYLSLATLRGFHKVELAAFIETLMLPAMVLSCLVVLKFIHVDDVKLAYFSAALLTSILVVWRTKVKYTLKWLKLSKKHISLMMKRSLHFFQIQILNYVNNWGLTYLIAFYFTPKDVGVYNVCWRLVVLSGIILLVMNSINGPKFSELYAKKKYVEIKKIVSLSSMITGFIGGLCLLPIFIFPELILGLWGDEFISGVKLVRVLVLAEFMNLLTGSLGYLLLMCGRDKSQKNITLFNVVMLLTFALLLGEHFGLIGIGYAYLIASCLKNVALLCVSRSLLKSFI